MKLFYYALLASATPLDLSLEVPNASPGEVNQVESRSGLDLANSRSADDALSERGLAKRQISSVPRSCWQENGKFKFTVEGIIIATEMIGNNLHYFVTVSAEGTYLTNVLMDLGHGTYRLAISERGSIPFTQGVMSIYAGDHARRV